VPSEAAIDQYLRSREPIDQPFSTQEFVDGVHDDNLTEADAAIILEELEQKHRVHRDQGAWQVGPPLPPMTVDQD
jgi:hypothetical protein